MGTLSRHCRSLLRVGKKLMASTQTRNLHEHYDDIGVFGVPFCLGQPRGGVKEAPQRLRDFGLIKALDVMGFKVTDLGDLQFEEYADDPPYWNIKYPRSIGKATKKISDSVESIINSGKLCLTLGGDHSLSLGTVHGHLLAEPDMVLVWVDAHADINPPPASPSGNIHGQVLSFLVHETQEYIPKIPGFEWIKPCLNARDIAYIGLRDLDPAESHIIEQNGITCYTMHDIDREGIHTVLDKAIKAVNPGLERPMHLSFDIDALDPSVSPSTGTPVPGGLTIREGMYIAEELANTGMLTAIDLVEVNPELGTKKDQDLTLFTACEIIAACFGKRRKGTLPPEYRIPRP